MARFATGRLLESLIVLGAMSFAVYVLIGLMPGDPIDLMISGNPRMTSEDAARLHCRAISAIRGATPSRCSTSCCRASAIP